MKTVQVRVIIWTTLITLLWVRRKSTKLLPNQSFVRTHIRLCDRGLNFVTLLPYDTQFQIVKSYDIAVDGNANSNMFH